MAHPFIEGYLSERGREDAQRARRAAERAVWESLSPADKKALKATMFRDALLENGYERVGRHSTRRFVFKELLEDPHYAFPRSYRPTQAEVFDKELGAENWVCVSTGRIASNRHKLWVEGRDVDDPAFDEVIDVYSRDSLVVSEHPSWQPATEIRRQLDERFPDPINEQ